MENVALCHEEHSSRFEFVFVEMSKYEPRDDQQTRHHAAQDKVDRQK